MWLGHFIEHLMCYGGELEHHKTPLAGKRKIEHWSALLASEEVYIGSTIGPGSWHEPGLTGSHWSRFMAPTEINSGGPGARSIGPGSSHQPGPKGPDEPGPMAHVARPAP